MNDVPLSPFIPPDNCNICPNMLRPLRAINLIHLDLIEFGS